MTNVNTVKTAALMSPFYDRCKTDVLLVTPFQLRVILLWSLGVNNNTFFHVLTQGVFDVWVQTVAMTPLSLPSLYTNTNALELLKLFQNLDVPLTDFIY